MKFRHKLTLMTAGAALAAGLDLEMPCRLFFDRRVAEAVAQGRLLHARIEDAALRIVRAQLRAERLGGAVPEGGAAGLAAGLAGSLAASPGADLVPSLGARPGNAREYGPEVIACAEHRTLAREAAVKSIVLLRNEPVPAPVAGANVGAPSPGSTLGTAPPGPPRPLLPLDPRTLRHLAVIGRLADVPNLGDHGSSQVTPPYVVTPLAGLRATLEPHGTVVLHDDGSDPDRAATLAAGAEAVVMVAGYDYRDEGEYLGSFPPPGLKKLLPRPPLWLLPQVLLAALALRRHGGAFLAGGGDRRSLTLHPDEEDLIARVAAANPRTVVVLMCGSAVIMESWRHLVPAILILWYPGMEGGHALADILFGRRKPTGRLPVTIPTSPEHLPPFDPDADLVEYGALHGQALLDHLGVPAAYPYGFGLTYQA